MIKKGDRFIVLKYSTGFYDCIQQHSAVIDEMGYCWFGKIGVAPSVSAIRRKLNGKRMLVILYCQGKTHLCDLLEVSEKKPEKGYPNYYESFLFDRGIYPKVYFKIGSISPISVEELSKCVILSSRKPMTETVSRSMASFFYAEYPENDQREPPKPKKINKIPRKTIAKTEKVVDKNTCIYRKEGVCNNKKCVNYQYECSRPSSCSKQKPAPLKG